MATGKVQQGAFLVPHLSGAQDPKKLARAWANYLGDYAWTHFITHTFESEVTVEGAKRTFQGWVRRIVRYSRGRVPWFAMVERSPGGLVHVHSFVHVRALGPVALQEAWFAGRCQALVYDAKLGARFYITKYIACGCGDHYDLSGNWIPIVEMRVAS